jgi:hypothetical protein
MEITIKISDEDIAKIADAIAARIGGAAPAVATITNSPKATPAPAPAADPVREISYDQLRAAAKDLVANSGAEGRAKLVKALKKHGAKNLSALPEEKYASIAADLGI